MTDLNPLFAMTTDYRALCVELVAIEDALSGGSVQFSNQGQALDGYSALATFRDVADRARALLAQPVAVSERLPGPKDCDAEDNCWWFDPHADGAWYVDTFQSCYTHWLPANALPTPEAKP